jgi:hypothetical protein
MVMEQIIPNGSTFRYEGYKYHVVKCIEDDLTKELIYVVRYYGKHKQWWHYEAWTQKVFVIRIENGLCKQMNLKH